MVDKKMEEWEAEVFIYDDDDGESRSLVVIDEKNNNVFSLEAKNYFGEMTEERKKKMKSIGVFGVYD